MSRRRATGRARPRLPWVIVFGALYILTVIPRSAVALFDGTAWARIKGAAVRGGSQVARRFRVSSVRPADRPPTL